MVIAGRSRYSRRGWGQNAGCFVDKGGDVMAKIHVILAKLVLSGDFRRRITLEVQAEMDL